MPEIVLKAEHLKKVFFSQGREFSAVDDLSFEIRRGECLAIVGESGSGKSTAARMITRLLDVTEGTIHLLGQEITGKKGRELRTVYRQMQMIFQMPAESFDPRRTLGDGIGESLRNQGMSRRETMEKVRGLLQKCGLSAEFADRYPHEVSGGQCQRAAIARALAVKPALLICDEATSALDVTVQKQVMELLIELKQKENLALLLICHDLALVEHYCDRVLVLHEGKMVESGIPEEIICHPREAYTRKLVESVI